MDLEIEYNNRARVPEHVKILAQLEQHAEQYRQSAGGECDLAYGPADRHRCDIFRSKEDTAHCMVVFVHGGYWQGLDKSSFSHMARGLEIHGIGTAVPSYRLCPDVTVGEIIDDIRQVCVWLWNRHKRHLVVAGHSAGGHLAAAMVATSWAEHGAPDDLVRAGFGISGVYDLRPLIATSLNGKLHLDDASARTASPLLWPAPVNGRFEAWVGAEESPEFLRQSKTLAACWSGAGARAKYVEAPLHNHFTIVQALGDPASDMTQALSGLCQ
ncbi:MAG: alpha/beta hydrolase [Aestuariivirgaceae bacterium]